MTRARRCAGPNPEDRVSESRWALVDGRRMHARISEDRASEGRPAVVLVHGLVVSSRYMVPTIRLLSLHYRVYAPDLPGFGKSEKPPRVLDVPSLSDSLATWMEAIGLERAAFVGNSLGCQVIADLAVRHPGRVEKVVLQGLTMDPRGRSALRQTMRLLLDYTLEPPSLWRVVLRDLLSAGVRVAVHTFRYALRDHVEEKLPHVQTPALIVRGSRDPICPQRWAEQAARLLPQGRLIVIPGAAHVMNYGAPSELAQTTRKFLDEGR